VVVKAGFDLHVRIAFHPRLFSHRFVSKKWPSTPIYGVNRVDLSKKLKNLFSNASLPTSGLAANRSAAAADPDEYVILPGVYGKDPMGPVVRQGDAQWRDIVNWVVFAMFEAEEKGVTSRNVDEMTKSDDETIQRFLGVKGELGTDLGLDNQWAYRIVKQVGNYGEVFERQVGKSSPLRMERGLNDLWTRGGLLYSPPFN